MPKTYPSDLAIRYKAYRDAYKSAKTKELTRREAMQIAADACGVSIYTIDNALKGKKASTKFISRKRK